MTYTALSLFSGAGGFDIGLERTGCFELLAMVEQDPTCIETLQTNHMAGRLGNTRCRVYQADIAKLDPARVMGDLQLQPGSLDLLFGGPPCTPWTTAGRRGGTNDPVGLMPWHLLEFVKIFRPRVFIVENVVGLLGAKLSQTAPKGSVLAEFQGDVPAEYRVQVLVADSAAYGTPQHRRRMFVVGNRLGREAVMPPPTHGPGLLPYVTVRDAISDLTQSGSACMQYTPKRYAVLKQVPTGGNWHSLPTDVAKTALGAAYGRSPGSNWYRRLNWDTPAPTLTTHPGSNQVCRCHPSETRPLSLPEYKRLMAFPDDWEFKGSLARQYKQIGNAVPPPLGAAVGAMAASLLDGTAPHSDQLNPRIPPPIWRHEPHEHEHRHDPRPPRTPTSPHKAAPLPLLDPRPPAVPRREPPVSDRANPNAPMDRPPDPPLDVGDTIEPERPSKQHPGVILAAKSMNSKLGYASATYVAKQSCPMCPFQGAGCYAEHGNTRSIWDRITAGSVGVLPLELARREAAMIDDLTAPTRDMRLHVAGDSTTTEGTWLIAEACERYVERARRHGRTVKVWAYTHAWATVPRAAWGNVSILASCETAGQMSAARDRGYASAIVLPEFESDAAHVVGTVKIIPCPQQTREKVCTDCRLCLDDGRLRRAGLSIGFALHGAGIRKAERALSKTRISLAVIGG